VANVSSKGQGHSKRKCKKIVSCVYLRQKWIEDQNDCRPILSNTFHQRKCFIFCDNL